MRKIKCCECYLDDYFGVLAHYLSLVKGFLNIIVDLVMSEFLSKSLSAYFLFQHFISTLDIQRFEPGQAILTLRLSA
jgi:hypothetical protein